jgi:short-subunit dehydrogenase
MSTIAMVTGATRGPGRGIARGLESREATLRVTGRDEANCRR